MKFKYLFFILLFFNCDNSIKEKELFLIEIGRYKDQLNIFSLNNQIKDFNIDFYFKDNFYYISNNASLKVMKFNSFGELLTIYNNSKKDNSIFPLLENKSNYNRKIINFDFKKTYNISVDNINNIYIEDEDNEDKKIIQKFRDENFLYSIGKYGKDSEGFNNIVNIYNNKENDLIVIEKDEIYNIYYIKDENITKKIEFNPDFIEKDYFINNIYPDLNNDLIYIYINTYYKEIINNKINKITNKDNYIYSYNIKNKEIKKIFELDQIYEYIGMDFNSNMFFVKNDQDKTHLFILKDEIKEIYKFNTKDFFLIKYHVNEGKIAVLKGKNEGFKLSYIKY